MRVNMMIKESDLPDGKFSLIEPEVQRRLAKVYPDVQVRVRKGENNQLDIQEKDKNRREKLQQLLEDIFDEADEWLYN